MTDRSATAVPAAAAPEVASAQRPWVYAIFLIVTGAIGWWAAFSLTLDKFAVLENPQADLDCNFNFLVQCGENLSSPQGALFGFPNPLIGVAAFIAPIAVGVGLLAGARFARWFWIAFNVGVVGALAFVVWLISQSVLVLGTLCPWCMLVWSVVIPMFWVVTLVNARDGHFGERLRRPGAATLSWVVPVVVASYAIVAVIAQVNLNVLAYIAP